MPKRFTIYDVMEARGDFTKNPANAQAVDPVSGISAYKKQPFPKMLFHPEGKERITRPGEAIATPLGVKMVGEQRELIYKIVQDEKELNLAIKEGWHLSPTAALKKAAELRGEKFDRPESAAETAAAAQESEIAKLRRQLAEAEEKNAALELGMIKAPAGASHSALKK